MRIYICHNFTQCFFGTCVNRPGIAGGSRSIVKGAIMSDIKNRFSPEVRARAVRMVLEHVDEYSSRWAAITSISAKIGCVPQTLNDWVKRNEV